jgi:hypothetical protein
LAEALASFFQAGSDGAMLYITSVLTAALPMKLWCSLRWVGCFAKWFEWILNGSEIRPQGDMDIFGSYQNIPTSG